MNNMNNKRIILNDVLDDKMAINFEDGIRIGGSVLATFESSAIELDFTGIISWNTAFFNGLIYKIVSEKGYEDFLKNKYFRLINQNDNISKTLSFSMDLADSKYGK